MAAWAAPAADGSAPTDVYSIMPDQARRQYEEKRQLSATREAAVATLVNPPYSGAFAYGLLGPALAARGAVRRDRVVLSVFRVGYYCGADGVAVTEYMDLPTLCANRWSCLSEDLADGIGEYHRAVALRQVQQARQLLQRAPAAGL